MNLSLHDPQFITADFPTTLTMTLSYGHSTALEISPCGHYIASGLLDGTLLIVDTWSNNITCLLRKHTMPIIGVKWIYSEDAVGNVVVGIVTWSRDWKVCILGLHDKKFIDVWENTFTGGIWNVDIVHTGIFVNDKWEGWELVVCRVNNGVCFVKNGDILECGRNGTEDDSHGSPICCVNFYGCKYVVCGTGRGWVEIVDAVSRKLVRSEKLCNGNVKGIQIVEEMTFDSDTADKYAHNNVPVSRLIINASDRILRQYDISDWYNMPIEDWKFEIEQKYQDVVNRIQWNTVKFSPSGEYVCASTQGGSGAAHDVYIWETSMGSLVQILEGSHEELIDVDWGTRSVNGNVCCIAANGMDSGTVYMWGVRPSQKWSALAPDFEEIEQNIEYVEHEDEFDINVVEEHVENVENDDDFNVDVVGLDDRDARGFKFIKGCIIDTVL